MCQEELYVLSQMAIWYVYEIHWVVVDRLRVSINRLASKLVRDAIIQHFCISNDAFLIFK